VTPSVFALLVVLGGVLATAELTLYLQLVFCLFGATAAVALPALGGASVTPSVLFLPFLLVRAWRERGARLLQLPKAGVWLGLLAVWALFTSVFMPRLLRGELQVLTVDRNVGDGVVMIPLGPVSGNITQSCYALGGLAAFLGVRALLLAPGRVNVFRDGVLLLTALDCGAALLNLAEFHLGFPSLLEGVRTASYANFSAYEEAGLMRIQGTFAETSAFAGFTLPLFAFCTSLWLDRVRPRYSGALALLTLTLLALSTSGTAYASLGLYLAGLALYALVQAYRRGRLASRVGVLAVGWVALTLVAAVLLFKPAIATGIAEFIDATVLNKLQSQSGLQRSSWNVQAFANFLQSYGLGAGLGSVRASSFPLVLLSNVGIVGTLLFCGFLLRVCGAAGKGAALENTTQRAARQALLALLVAASVSGGVFDLGVLFYAFAAASSLAPAFAAARAQHAMSSWSEPLPANLSTGKVRA